MDAEQIKTQIKTIVENNPRPIEFILNFSGEEKEECYTTKHAFGCRLLELINDPCIDGLTLTMFKQRNFCPMYNQPMKSVLEVTDLEKIQFNVVKIVDTSNFSKDEAIMAFYSDPNFKKYGIK